MEYLTLVLLSLSLSMDAFTVSICDGLAYQNIKKWQAFFIAFMFGLFQALFPLIGYYIGKVALAQIEAYDHWVAFGLLLIIGGKMVYDGIKGLRSPETSIKPKTFNFWEVITQSVAVSIDALAVGLTLLDSTLSIYINIAFIGLITFAICLIGFLLGKKIMSLTKGRYEIAEVIGGIVLILLGVKMALAGEGLINF